MMVCMQHHAVGTMSGQVRAEAPAFCPLQIVIRGAKYHTCSAPTDTHRLASTIGSHNQRQGLEEVNCIVVVWVETSDALNEHLR